MSIADCSTIQPDLYGGPSKVLLTQSSCSSDTGDFIREATEQVSFCDNNAFSTNLFAPSKILSEDEISFSFPSANSSHHSLLWLVSPTHRNSDNHQVGVYSDNSVSSGDVETQTGKERRLRRQEKVATVEQNSAQSQKLDGDVLTNRLSAGEGDSEMEMELSCESVSRDKMEDGSEKQAKKPQRRQRRHALASCLQNPLQDNRPSTSERKGSGGDEGMQEDLEKETVTTPRQRKTYSIEDRLQIPVNMQLDLINQYSSKPADDIDQDITPPAVADYKTEESHNHHHQLTRLPQIKLDNACEDNVESYPSPPASPVTTEGLFYGERDIDVEGSSMSVDYNHQSQLEDMRVPAGNGYGVRGGVVEGMDGDSSVIGSLLAKFPHLSNYPVSSLLDISHYASSRKMSDSAVIMRKNRTLNSHLPQKHRCVSDSAAPHFVLDDDKNSEISGWSHVYCDSGYNDEKSSRCHGSNSSAYMPSPRVSLHSSDLLSQDEGTDNVCHHSHNTKPHRRLTPYIVCSQMKEDSSSGASHEDVSVQVQSGGTMVRPRERSRRSLIKNFSQSSLGASSAGTGGSSETISLTSLFECQSPLTVEDVLSNLGFDDFNSPQLIPDRFIPKEIEHAKPSIMRTMTLSEYNTYDSPSNSYYSSYEPSIASTSYSAPVPHTHHHISHSSQHHQVHSASTASLPGNYTLSSVPADPTPDEAPPTHVISNVPSTSDLPLGATAENFLAPRSVSPPPPAQSSQQPPEREVPSSRNVDARFQSTNVVGFHRGRLETVPEETASDLSPSPRWLSPRVSIDHSVNFDVAEGKLGASLNVQKVRKRSLPTQREGYKLSVGSLVESDTGGDSIHFSVTSYDDEIAAEREKEREDTLPHLSLEDLSLHQQQHRRRRRGVYTPPPALLSWLSQQKPIHEEDMTDPDELPWPFNEQARLRKSLTEIQQAQIASGSFDVSMETRELANESQSSGDSSKAEGCCSISSSPPSSIARCSPGPHEDDSQDDGDEMSSKINNSFPPRRRHSRDNSSTSSLQTSHKTRSLSCQSDYHLLRKDLDTLSSHVGSGGEDGLLRIEIEELRYTMSATQKRLSKALAIKGDQCRQLQEKLGACKQQLFAVKCKRSAIEKRLKREAKHTLQRELGDLKHKMTQERSRECKQLQEKHSREMSELRQLKAAEIQMLTNRLIERTETSSALSSELKEFKRQAEMRENKIKSQAAEEICRMEKLIHQEKVSSLARLQEELTAQKIREISSLKERLLNEKKTAIARVEQKMADQLTKLQQQLQKTKENCREEIVVLETELTKQLAEEREKSEQLREALSATKKELEEAQKYHREADKKHQTRDRKLRRSVTCQQRDLVTGLLEEWQLSAEVARVKKPVRSLSQRAGVEGGGGENLNSAAESALAGLRNVNETLRCQISGLKEQLEREKQANTAAHRAKVAEVRKLRAYAQMDKQKNMKELEAKLKKEHSLEITSLRLLLGLGGDSPIQRGGAPGQVCVGGSPSHQEQGGVARRERDSKPASSPSHSYCKLEMETLRLDLKTQRQALVRAKALFSEKVQEVTDLQSKIKQITMEQLHLEKGIQKAFPSS